MELFNQILCPYRWYGTRKSSSPRDATVRFIAYVLCGVIIVLAKLPNRLSPIKKTLAQSSSYLFIIFVLNSLLFHNLSALFALLLSMLSKLTFSSYLHKSRMFRIQAMTSHPTHNLSHTIIPKEILLYNSKV